MLTAIAKFLHVRLDPGIPLSVLRFEPGRITAIHRAEDFYPSQRTVSFEATLNFCEWNSSFDPEPPKRCTSRLWYKRHIVSCSLRYLQTTSGRKSKVHEFTPTGVSSVVNGERVITIECGTPDDCAQKFAMADDICIELARMELIAREVEGELEDTAIYKAVFIDGPVSIPAVQVTGCDTCVNVLSSVRPKTVKCPKCLSTPLPPYPRGFVVKKLPCPPTHDLINCQCVPKTCPQGMALSPSGDCIDTRVFFDTYTDMTFIGECATLPGFYYVDEYPDRADYCGKATQAVRIRLTIQYSSDPLHANWYDYVNIRSEAWSHWCRDDSCPPPGYYCETPPSRASNMSWWFDVFRVYTTTKETVLRYTVGPVYSSVGFNMYPGLLYPPDCVDEEEVPFSVFTGPDFDGTVPMPPPYEDNCAFIRKYFDAYVKPFIPRDWDLPYPCVPRDPSMPMPRPHWESHLPPTEPDV